MDREYQGYLIPKQCFQKCTNVYKLLFYRRLRIAWSESGGFTENMYIQRYKNMYTFIESDIFLLHRSLWQSPVCDGFTESSAACTVWEL